MSPKEIIENIEDIYDKFPVPPFVVKHCLLVRDVIKKIISQLKKVTVDVDLLVASALVHDLGNIAKIDFNSSLAIKMYSEEERIFWNNRKKIVLEFYGNTDHKATKAMLEEINCSKKIIDLLEFSSWENIIEVSKKDNWNAKILSYADYRVAPFGIVSLSERLKDLKKRYEKTNKESNLSSKDIQNHKKAYFFIEKQLEEKGLNPKEIK